jgi:hypothetical protein
VAEERGYLVPDFDWDQLVTYRQQLSTPEWTPEELRRVTEAERQKTLLWYWLTTPSALIRTIFKYLGNNPMEGLRMIWRFGTSLLGLVVHKKVKTWGT